MNAKCEHGVTSRFDILSLKVCVLERSQGSGNRTLVMMRKPAGLLVRGLFLGQQSLEQCVWFGFTILVGTRSPHKDSKTRNI